MSFQFYFCNCANLLSCLYDLLIPVIVNCNRTNPKEAKQNIFWK